MTPAVLLLALSLSAPAEKPLRTVERVDLKRYMGTWYEIARLPTRFQKDCLAAVAMYSLREDGEVDVVNRCRQGRLDGPIKLAKGRAWRADESGAKLKVSFFWPFRGDYWVLELGDGYEYAVVGEPDRRYLWVLSRTPKMDPAVLEVVLERARQQGYDLEGLIRTEHPAG